MIYLTAIGQSPGGSSTVNINTQTIQRTSQNKQCIEQHKNTQNNTKIHRTTQKKYIEQHNNQEECGPCPVFAGFTLAFALQLRKKHGTTSVRVAIHKHKMRMHSHNNKNRHDARSRERQILKLQWKSAYFDHQNAMSGQKESLHYIRATRWIQRAAEICGRHNNSKVLHLHTKHGNVIPFIVPCIIHGTSHFPPQQLHQPVSCRAATKK